MDGKFELHLTNGTAIQLKFTKRVFYEFEKRRDRPFMALFTRSTSDGGREVDLLAVQRTDIQVELAFLAQLGLGKDRLSEGDLIDLGDSKSLDEMVAFAIQQYASHRGVKVQESEESKAENPT